MSAERIAHAGEAHQLQEDAIEARRELAQPAPQVLRGDQSALERAPREERRVDAARRRPARDAKSLDGARRPERRPRR